MTKTMENNRKIVITVKKVLKALSLICFVIVFCPTFLVSCSGQNMNVSVMTAVGGVSISGERVVAPHPIMLLCLIIPMAVFILLSIKKYTDKKNASIIAIGGGVDLIIWIIFRSGVKKAAEDIGFTFKTTGWYVINIIFLMLIILLTSLIVVGKLQMESDLIAVLSGKETQNALNQMSATMSQMSTAVTQWAGNVASNVNNRNKVKNPIGFCAKCGTPIGYGSHFCTSCGTPVPQSMIDEAEAARKEAEEKAKIAEEEAGKMYEKEMPQNSQSIERQASDISVHAHEPAPSQSEEENAES